MLERAVAAAGSADAAVVIVGLNADWETEGHDRASLELPGRQVELIEKVAAANPRTIVVVNAGAPIDMGWIDRVPAALFAWYPGQEAGHALADLVFGDANPSGRLPTTFPMRIEDTPSYGHYPGEGGKVVYGEGLLVGYRHYDAKGIQPRFPFGHGLSYTRFEYGDPELPDSVGADRAVVVRVPVRNAGAVAGSEVVQAYLSDRESRLPRAPRELAAFTRVTLEPGESTTASLTIEPRALASWDPEQHTWVTEPGEFEIAIGASCRDLRARARFTLEG
jgi:beta-glucosidase